MIEKYIVERGFKEGWIKPNVPNKRSKKRIAIIGSGPAGLAAAQQLNKAGHNVEVFERDKKIGGLVRYGIPDFKMEKHVIDRRINILKEEGIKFKTNIDVGENYSIRELKWKNVSKLTQQEYSSFEMLSLPHYSGTRPSDILKNLKKRKIIRFVKSIQNFIFLKTRIKV